MKMTQLRKYVVFLSLAVFMLLVNICASAQVSVLTQHNNNQRTGANLNETTLNTSNVNGNQFGLLFKLAVDDQVWASPLYVAALSIGGVTHNVVYVATANNTVFAFDADRGGTALWSRNFNNGGRPTDHTEVGTGGFCNPYVDMVGHIGIVGTPVIDSSTNTMYFVARTVEGGGTVQRLHAIDITTGNDRAQVVIQANGFDPVVHNQRPALTLSQGVVYIAWSSYCDFGGYHGFVMGYDASTLQQVHVFNDTPGGSQGGIWQAGQGASVDSNGDLYWETGNGSSNPNAAQFSESFIKLNPSNGLSVQDWFMPSDFASLNNGDRDLGSSGPVQIPGTSRILGGGKDGIFFLLDTNNMGHLVNNDTQIVQKFQATFVHNGCATLHIHGSPVYWNSNSSGPLIYVWGENDFLREFQFNGSTLNTSAIHTSTMTAATCGMPGCQLSVSANGGATGSGVLWANCVLSGDANHATTSGLIRAFDADDVSTELWDSQQNAGRDSCNNYSKYSYPVVANGKVYLSSFGTAGNNSGQLCIYGLLPSPPPEAPFGGTPAAIPGTVQAENYDTGGQGVAYNVSTVNGTGNNYRSDGVDLEATTDTGGGFNLGWTTGGQWFKYTVNVATAGTHTVSFRVAAPTAVTDAFHLANSAGTNLTGAVNVPATGGWQTWTTVTATVTRPAGVQTLTLDQDNAGWNLNYAIFTATASGEAPFGGTPAAIPGTVQAENYDTGGQGVAYNVSTVNGTGNNYRSDGVDLEATTDTGGGFNLGWTTGGQWFKYTVNVATAGTYTVSFRVAAMGAVTDAFHLANSAGTNLTGAVNVPATGGWQTWTTVTATVTRPAGVQTLTLDQDNAGWNLNYAIFTATASGEAPFGGTPAAIPGTVQAENYDTGGQGVAYNVSTVNGTGNNYRSDGVDLEATTDTGGGFNLGWTTGGQWFKYTVNVATAGTYTVSFRVAAMGAVTDAFHLANSAGTNLTGAVNVPA